MISTRYNKFLLLLFLPVFLWPCLVHASLTISEIAWMGTEDSANDEWIELYNDGNELSVEGWQLLDGKGLEIDLTGTISANSHVVLERTDDTSAPGVAFLLYTGALSNTGSTLQLYDADGALVDQVAGGEDWENIGGDNTTKETAQLTSNGWVTAPPTPGRALDVDKVVMNETEQKEEDKEEDEISTIVSAKSEKVTTLHIIPRELSVDITIPTRAYVNQEVMFSAQGSGLSDAILQSLDYVWNFGDATTGRGESPKHIYKYPGNYVVTIVASYGEYVAEYRETVTVLPTPLSITKLDNGDIQIHNDAKYEVDVSGYRVGGVPGVVLPDRTIMLPNSTVTIPNDRFHNPSVAVVFDNTNYLVYGKESVPEEQLLAAEPAVKTLATSNTETFSFKEEVPNEVTADKSSLKVVTEAQAASVSNIGTTTKEAVPSTWPWYTTIGLMSLAVIGVYTRYL